MANFSNRRNFLKKSIISAASLGSLPIMAKELNKIDTKEYSLTPSLESRIDFGVIGINHGHIYSMSSAIINGGGNLTCFYASEDNLSAEFQKKFPQAKRLKTKQEVLDNKDIKLILSAAIPNERANIGIEAMLSGKDFMADKPGITSLKQLNKVKEIQKQTNKIFAITYSERFENRATVRAGDLVEMGAIGKVIQTIGLGPHRMNAASRPEWFFNAKNYGGIITDIASHQFDQFLFFTKSTEATVVASQIGNVNHPQYPDFEDFGDVMVKGNNGTGYIRVDWFTPDGLGTWGDGRLTILGTEGYIEIRKNIDIGQYENGNHLYLVNNKETKYIDCNQVELPFGKQMVDDVVNRTETAMTQSHCFLTMELALKAQKMAKKLYKKS